MSKLIIAVLPLCFYLSSIHHASADSIPMTATKLSLSELKEIYSGKTLSAAENLQLFSPDGKFLMVGKNDTWFAKGTWSARGDAVCATSNWVDLPSKTKGTDSHCWRWYKIDKKYYSSFKPNKGGYGAYSVDSLSELKPGDGVSAKLAAVEQKARQ